MALNPGARLGPYEIEAPAGAGGMGEVYRAKDTRLERTVAIKVLPQSPVSGSDARTRFEREAKIISSLNHPHICTLYDVGQQDGTDYLVMEFLEGETLEDRLVKRRLTTAEALRYGAQIAGALDVAHRKGLIHRDLKPSNIFLTNDGAKLLDFGLAKLQAESVLGMAAETRTTPVTGVGMIVGTLQYMSPEQLEGKEADVRSDIFAFGATLYEMLAGRRAFEGESRASLIGSIMKDEPRPLSEIQPTSPPVMDRLIRKCLRKNPEDRWQSAKDLKDELEWIASAGSQAGVAKFITSKRLWRFRLSWLLTVLTTAATVVLGYLLLSQEKPQTHTMRFCVPLPQQVIEAQWPQISPDGRLLAFLATDSSGTRSIWIRPLNGLTAYPLPGTEKALRPFWSPDGRYLAFFEDGDGKRPLKKIEVTGGHPSVICEADGADGDWGPNDVILFDGYMLSICKVSANGGTPRPVTVVDSSAHEDNHGWPSFLPDGRHFIFVAFTDSSARNGNGHMLKLGNIDNTECRTLGIVDTRAMYCEPGYILCKQNGSLVALPFDADRGEFTGDPIPLSNETSFASGAAEGINLSASRNGILATIPDAIERDSISRLAWVSRQGKILDTIGPPGIYRDIVLSPDGSRLAYTAREEGLPKRDLWVRDLNSGAVRKLADEEKPVTTPVWSPDGTRLAYSTWNTSKSTTYWCSARGTGERHVIKTPDSAHYVVTGWYPDDRILLAQIVDLTTHVSVNLGMATLQNPDQHTILTQQAGLCLPTSISPDGQYILYLNFPSMSSSEARLQVMDVDDHRRWELWKGELEDARWNRNPSEIYVLSANRGAHDLYAISVDDGDDVHFGKPSFLFSLRPSNIREDTWFRFACAAGGQKFIFALPSANTTAETPQFQIVVNWYAELGAR